MNLQVKNGEDFNELFQGRGYFARRIDKNYSAVCQWQEHIYSMQGEKELGKSDQNEAIL